MDEGRHGRRRSIYGRRETDRSIIASSRLAGLSAAAQQRGLEALFGMQYDNPAHREMMDLEGLKAWLPGRTSGFGPLVAAVVSERFFERPASS